MSLGGIEVYVPIRECADRDHEYLVASTIRNVHPTAYVEFRRIPAAIGMIDNIVNDTLTALTNAILQLPY